jgi:hypothetical protein
MFHEKRELREQFTRSIEVVDLWLSKMTISIFVTMVGAILVKKG